MNLENFWDELVEKLPGDIKSQFNSKKAQLIKKKQERELLIKKLHPNDSHWPPHEDCPACQKLFQKLENEAKVILGESAKDAKLLEEKCWELFCEKYKVVQK